MTTHSEKKIVPYSPEQMFALVADIRKYPEFIPWCVGMRVRSDDVADGAGRLVADMAVRFKVFREKFTSQVDLDAAAKRIHVQYLDGPFRYLNNVWSFIENPDGSCTIDFYIDFEFKNPLLQMAMSSMFDKAVDKMVAAFVTRAYAVYGGSGRAAPMLG
ncbi:MAG: type II toxin-antitoxin system RatA family toxin [Parvularculaceae bacterium]